MHNSMNMRIHWTSMISRSGAPPICVQDPIFLPLCLAILPAPKNGVRKKMRTDIIRDSSTTDAGSTKKKKAIYWRRLFPCAHSMDNPECSASFKFQIMNVNYVYVRLDIDWAFLESGMIKNKNTTKQNKSRTVTASAGKKIVNKSSGYNIFMKIWSFDIGTKVTIHSVRTSSTVWSCILLISTDSWMTNFHPNASLILNLAVSGTTSLSPLESPLCK